MGAKVLFVDAGVILRLASAITQSGGNLLNALLQPGVLLVIPDAVVTEVTWNLSYSNTPVIKSWLTLNATSIFKVITSTGADAQADLDANGFLKKGEQYGDMAIIQAAPGFASSGSSIFVASEDSEFAAGIPGIPGSVLETTLGVREEPATS